LEVHLQLTRHTLSILGDKMRDIYSYEKEYLKSDFEIQQVKYRKRKILETVNDCKGGKILEIGCGDEPLFPYINNYKKYTVVEPAETFYKKAKILAKGYPNVVVKKDYFNYSFINQNADKYNYVILSGLLHEIEEPIELLECIKMILEDNAFIHINVPNAMSFHRLLALEMGIINSIYEKSDTNIRLQQTSVFDLNSLAKMIEDVFDKSDYKILSSGSYFVKPFTHEQMQKCIDMKIFDTSVLEGLYKMEKWIPNLGSEIYINIKYKGN